MLTKLEQRSWIKIRVAWARSTQECFQWLFETCGNAVLPYHTAIRWVKVFQDAIQGNLCTGQSHMENNRVQFLASQLDADHRWIARELAVEVWVCHNSAWHSGLPQTCNTLDTTWNFRGATMAPLCSRKSLVGPVSNGTWLLSWTNHRYGWNLGSLIWTKLETPIKWMEAS